MRLRIGLALALLLAPLAHSAALVPLSLDAGPLWAGLQQFAQVTGQRVLVPDGSSALASLRHPALSGTYSVDDALDRLLAGSGYTWRRDARGSILVIRAREMHSTLDTLEIQADALQAPSPSTPGAWTRGDPAAGGIAAPPLVGARLQAAPPRRVGDVLRRAPNVSGQGVGLSIRGIERGANIGATSGVYLDGIPLGTHLLDEAALPDLQRVDYLRGPRPIRDGSGAMAGVLRMETPEPHPEADASLRLSATPRERELRLRGAGQIAGLGPSYSGGIVLQQDAGSIDNIATGERGVDAGEEGLLQGRLLYEPDRIENLSVRASALLLRGNPGLPGVVPAGVTPLPVGLRSPGFDPFDRESFDPLPRTRRLGSQGGALEVEWQPRASSRVLAYAQSSRTVLDSNIVPGGRSGERQQREDIESALEFGLRWETDWSGGWRSRLGLDRAQRRSRLTETVISPLRGFFPANVPVEVTPDTERRLSVSAHNAITAGGVLAEVEWTGSHLGAGFGLRRVAEDRSALRVIQSQLSQPDCVLRIGNGAPIACEDEFPALLTQQRTPSDDSVLVPHLRAAWQPDPVHRLALEMRRGHVGGGARLDTTSGVLAPYRPERSDTIDLGWTAQWLDGRLQLDATLFHNRWIDRHVPLDLPQRENYVIVNAGRAQAHGAEFELQWRPDAALTAWIGIGVLRTRYDTFEARLPEGLVDLKGREFPGAPRLTATGGAQWRFAPRWRLSASAWHSGAAYSDPLNSPSGRRRAYTVLDLLLRHELDATLAVEGGLRNAFDEEYLEDIRIAGVDSRPREYSVGRPRELSLALHWSW